MSRYNTRRRVLQKNPKNFSGISIGNIWRFVDSARVADLGFFCHKELGEWIGGNKHRPKFRKHTNSNRASTYSWLLKVASREMIMIALRKWALSPVRLVLEVALSVDVFYRHIRITILTCAQRTRGHFCHFCLLCHLGIWVCISASSSLLSRPLPEFTPWRCFRHALAEFIWASLLIPAFGTCIK